MVWFNALPSLQTFQSLEFQVSKSGYFYQEVLYGD